MSLGLPTIRYFPGHPVLQCLCLMSRLGRPAMQNIPYFRYSHSLHSASTHIKLQCNKLPKLVYIAFRALTLLVGRKEGHPACKKLQRTQSSTLWLTTKQDSISCTPCI